MASLLEFLFLSRSITSCLALITSSAASFRRCPLFGSMWVGMGTWRSRRVGGACMGIRGSRMGGAASVHSLRWSLRPKLLPQFLEIFLLCYPRHPCGHGYECLDLGPAKPEKQPK